MSYFRIFGDLGFYLQNYYIKDWVNNSMIFLEVRDRNNAYIFYTSMGFQAIGRRSGYYKSTDGNKHDSITMALAL